MATYPKDRQTLQFPVVTAASLLLLALPLQIAPAQLTGIVRDSSVGAPMPGVVVQLLDSAGRAYDRAITDVAGRYRVAPTATTTRAQFLRLGYRPRDIRLTGDSTLDVAMVRLPTFMTQVSTVANRSCPRRRDSDAAF